MDKPTALKLVNALSFQILWVSTVWGAANQRLWPAALVLIAFVLMTLASPAKRLMDLRTLLLVVPLGFALDSIMVSGAVYRFAHETDQAMLAPAWIAFLWIGFALTLNHSLAFLRKSPWFAAAFGLFGAPLSYWIAANAFGAVSFRIPAEQALLLIGLLWALALPLWLNIGARWTRAAEAT